MKAKVIRAFTDKESGKTYKVGATIDLKDARFEFLKGKGVVVVDTADVADTKAIISGLEKENAALKAEVAELKAIIEKAADEGMDEKQTPSKK